MDYIPVIDLVGIADKPVGTIKDNATGCTLLSIPNTDLPRWQKVATQMREALSGIGFMYLINHGVSQEVISAAFTGSAQFFSLPEQIKSKYRKNASVSSHGWVQAGQELLHPNSAFELRECFDVAGNERFYPTPEQHPNFREVMEKLEKEGKVLMRKLLKLLGLSLELEDTDYFIKCCRHLDKAENCPVITNECDLRAIYYPAISDHLQVPPGAVRTAEHTDYETFTLLWQDDVGGLEVKTVDGKWIPAKPIPNSILVNTGDLLEIWTSGFYPATLHRVVIPEEEIEKRTPRYSFAYFFAPDDDTLILPLISSPYIFDAVMTAEDNGKEMSASNITAYKHIMNRVKSAYQY